MQVEVHSSQGGTEVVTLAGEVDLTTAARLRAELLALARSEVLVIDLREVTFMDSTGMGVLVGRLRSARQTGQDLRLVMTHGRVRRNFEITGLERIFPIYHDLESACAAGGSAS